MASRGISRRSFLSGIAAAGALPALWPGDALAQAGPPPPPNVRLASPLPPAGGGSNRQLLGGWRLTQEFARGGLAIDFATMRCWMTGHPQRSEVLEFNLPAMGTGTDIDAWPRVNPVRVIPDFWQGDGYANGLCFWRGKLWAATRVHYAQNADIAAPVRLFAADGEVITIPSLLRQRFGGFVKRGPNQDPLLGCGGYDSGHGTQMGPSLGTLTGQVLIQYGTTEQVGSPGANLENWNLRAPREPNYTATVVDNLADPSPEVGDSWMGWNPRTVNGQLQGRWACDVICGGGLVLPEGITYWPIMGVGTLDYRNQSTCFADRGNLRTYAYRYDPATFQFLGYQAQPEFDNNNENAAVPGVFGQELGPDGRVYLNHGYQWQSGVYRTDAALRVFG